MNRCLKLNFLSAVAAGIALAPSAVGAQVDLPEPPGSVAFGSTLILLPNGNFVVTDPMASLPVPNAGAVHLFGPTGVLLSTLTGSSTNDHVGSGGIIVLANGNFVVRSGSWGHAGAASVGAVTWVDGNQGLAGVVSETNSLIGTTANDQIGGGQDPHPVHGGGAVIRLRNGNYVVLSPVWNNGAIADAGAVTWGDGRTGISGAVSVKNSWVGTAALDEVGENGATELTNGNFVFVSRRWNDGATADVGAVTWARGDIGGSGTISAANSLIGTTAGDEIGSPFGGGVTALSNGNYVVASAQWDHGVNSDAGAVTWGDGRTGISGLVSERNSLVGSTALDRVGYVVALRNGNFVVGSPRWDNGVIADAGAVTWGDGASGISGVISAENSLVGTTASDFVGNTGITQLSNGNYVVVSPTWGNGLLFNVGAVTWGNGGSGITGIVSAANSLVGTTRTDQVGLRGVTALNNGNYVVASPHWGNGPAFQAGAVTWGDGRTGISGAVSSTNSLIGMTAGDAVGGGSVVGLSNGNYVIASPGWDSGGIADVGAATWGNGTTGTPGPVSPANSLIGTTAHDQVGGGGIVGLTGGNYVVVSPGWDQGETVDVGAVSWADGATGRIGMVSAANSLIGTTADDQIGGGSLFFGQVGFGSVTALTNGNYIVGSPFWDGGAAKDVGAVTRADGSIGRFGPILAAKSLIGTTAEDFLGLGGGFAGQAVIPFGDGTYALNTPLWHNSNSVSVSALSLAVGASGLIGVIQAENSVLGDVGNFVYDAGRGHLIVIRPDSHRFTLFTPGPDGPSGGLRITSIRPTATGFVLTWLSRPGQKYEIEFAEELGSEEWFELKHDIQSGGVETSYSDSSSGSPGLRQGYYRIRETGTTTTGLQITSIRRTATGFALTWLSRAGANYSVQFAEVAASTS